jgi:hypothetical protein
VCVTRHKRKIAWVLERESGDVSDQVQNGCWEERMGGGRDDSEDRHDSHWSQMNAGQDSFDGEHLSREAPRPGKERRSSETVRD